MTSILHALEVLAALAAIIGAGNAFISRPPERFFIWLFAAVGWIAVIAQWA